MHIYTLRWACRCKEGPIIKALSQLSGVGYMDHTAPMHVSMFNRFDIVLRWLPKPNTTLLLYQGLRPNIGGVFWTSRTFFLVILSRILSLNILLLKRVTGLCLHFHGRRTKRTYTCIHNLQHKKNEKKQQNKR